MTFKLPFIMLAVGVTALTLIAFSPAIYAAIEPHITITMDPGQSTNPLQIKDDSNNDVFSIDTTGQIFPEQHEDVELTYHKLGDTVVDWERSALPTTETDFSHQGVLAQWLITWDPSRVQQANGETIRYPSGDSSIASMLKRDSGSSSCRVGIETDDKYDVWGSGGLQIDSFCSSSCVNGQYIADKDDWQHDTMFDIERIRLVAYAGPSTTCTIADIDFYASLHLYPDMTITREK